MHLLNWKRVTKSKKLRGLGLHSPMARNLASMARLV